MRKCPKCTIAFEQIKKTFAEIDICPQCAGVFLDPGEGVAIHGTEAEAGFLVSDGRAHLVRNSAYRCPSESHSETLMLVYAIGRGDDAIELDYCPTCRGCFLDHGEGAALEAVEANELKTSSGATFAAPPPVDRHSQVIDETREQRGTSLFELFVVDVLQSARQGLARGTTDRPLVPTRQRRS